MKAIGIDIGTTSICGVLLDVKTGKVLDSVTKNSDAFIKTPNELEKIQDAKKIITIAKAILDSLIDKDVVSIGVTGQMHGIVYTDKAGNAVSPLYTWQDKRGDLPYKDTTYAKYLNSFSGYGNVTDFYNRENGLVPSNAESYLTISDYFVMKLCGLKKPIMHSTNAASLGCYDLIKNKFNYDLNISVTTDCCVAGEYRGIPVSVAIGDNQASVFSSLSCDDDVLLNIGTGSQVSLVFDRIVEEKDIETRPYFDGKYLIVGSALCGGRAYSLLKDFYMSIVKRFKDVSESEMYDVMNSLLEECTHLTLKVDTRFAGTRCDTEKRASISNLSPDNFNASQLSFGVLWGMAEELYELYRKMGIKKSGIVGTGNGVRKNKTLTKIIEEKFGLKAKTPKYLEEAAFGAALFSLISCGVFKNTTEAQKLIKYN